MKPKVKEGTDGTEIKENYMNNKKLIALLIIFATMIIGTIVSGKTGHALAGCPISVAGAIIGGFMLGKKA